MSRLAPRHSRTLWLLVAVAGCGRTTLLTDFSPVDADDDAVSGTSGSSRGGTGAGGSSAGGVAVGARGGIQGGAFNAGGRPGGPAGRGSGVGGSSLPGRGGGGGVAVFAGAGGTSAGTGGAAGRPSTEYCRNGFVDPGEQCDAGDGPYAEPAIELSSGGISIELMPVTDIIQAAAFYDYFDESSHTNFESVSGSKLYFYRANSENTISLITHHGIDFNATGFVQPDGVVHFAVKGLPDESVLTVADDPGEVVKDTPATLVADWIFGRNSDGFVVGGFALPGHWHVYIAPDFEKGIKTFTAVSGDGFRTGLALNRVVELIAHDAAGGCRRDCTLPRCGDGRLDAGEVCDDGNDRTNDGCTACKPDGFDPMPTPR
jgi:cysteine-rich repeat protein